ncbi:TIGR03905 family TSCPD domain-containing protein [Clostridium sp.]|uniref:TIGR03905 family TSCPD domain-containing protein n=1 Tax=Clostridium sp. TaxID=1506 RepID=UPI0026DB3395|nr:TIGR03905 family TSCPD domain-containing protein [Clostridium sp.]MDO5038407.1 TIGR03905 family TSCPD domain-containing protein [Clostridium sp.]
MYTYKTTGVCSTEIHIDVENNTIKTVEFVRGCPGNLFGISKLVEGMNIDDAISKLEGIKCGNKDTSCPDQLSKALKEYKNKK